MHVAEGETLTDPSSLCEAYLCLGSFLSDLLKMSSD